MIQNDSAKDFIKRLELVRDLAAKKRYPLDTVPGFVSTLEQDHIFNIHDSVLKDPELLARIAKLGNNEQIYIKRENKDPNMRSFCITRDASGEFALIIEPKSKRFDNSKRDFELEHGGFKTRKIAIRSDLELPKLYASLISYESDPSRLVDFDNEIKEQQAFDNTPGFAKIIKGDASIKQISKNGKQFLVDKRVIYSPYQEYNLIQFLKHNPDLSKEQRAELVLQVLEIVQRLHASKKEHKDFKLENFLVDYDPKQCKYVLNLSDFGLVRDIGSPLEGIGTDPYLPPWIVRGICYNLYQAPLKSILDIRNSKLFPNANNYTDTFAAEIMRRDISNPVLCSIGSDTCDGKHDIWSLGIMFYEILYSINSSYSKQFADVSKDHFLKHIFQLTANDTPDINELLELFNHTEYSIQAESYRATTHDIFPAEIQLASRTDIIDLLLNQRRVDPDIFYDAEGNRFMLEHQQQIQAIFRATTSSIPRLKVLANQIAENHGASQNSDSVNVRLYHETMLYLVNKKIDKLEVLKQNGFFRRWVGKLYKNRNISEEQALRLETIKSSREIIHKLEDDHTYVSRFKKQ